MTGALLATTTYYGLNKINFAAPRWHDLANENMDVIDALLFSALQVQGVRGIWQNSTEYLIGDRALDTANSTVYECLINHTSPVSGTFAAARTAHPTRWTEVGVDAGTLDGEDGSYYLNYANFTGSINLTTAGADIRIPNPTGVRGIDIGPSSDNSSGRLFLRSSTGNAATLININGTLSINFGGTYGSSSGTGAVFFNSNSVDIAHGLLLVADGSGDGIISNEVGEYITLDNTATRIGFFAANAAVGYIVADGLAIGRGTALTSVSDTGTGASLLFDGLLAASRSANPSLLLKRTTSNGQIAVFGRDTTTVGNISVTTTATAYNTSSDGRLKTNVNKFFSSGSIIDGIDIVTFDWIINNERAIGMIAQDVEKVAPWAVTTDDSEDGYKSVDFSKFVPVMMAELKNIRRLITYNYDDNVLDGVAYLPLTPRQFYLALYLEAGKLEEDIDVLLNQLTDPARVIAKIEKSNCMFFLRTHNLVEQIGAGLGLTKEQINALWKKGETL